MLTFGVEAAEGWLSLLAILPAAALPAANSPADAEVSPAVTTPAVPAKGWIAQMPLKSLSELAVTGNELAEVLEKRPGPWLGNMLSALLQATASGDLLNNKQELLLEAKRMDGHEL
ncbi:CCA-adding enzyme [compost metagenome]